MFKDTTTKNSSNDKELLHPFISVIYKMFISVQSPKMKKRLWCYVYGYWQKNNGQVVHKFKSAILVWNGVPRAAEGHKQINPLSFL